MKRFHTFLTFAFINLSAAGYAEETRKNQEGLSPEDVRAAIMQDPEMILDALGLLEMKRQQEEMNESIERISKVDPDFFKNLTWLGEHSEYQIIVFSDYSCGYCKLMQDELEEILNSNQAQVALVEFPILGERSRLSAIFALAVKDIYGAKTYKTVHDKLYDLETVNLDAFREILTEIDVNPIPVMDVLNEEKYNLEIQRNLRVGQQIGINGTPGFVAQNKGVINGGSLTGAVKQLYKLVE